MKYATSELEFSDETEFRVSGPNLELAQRIQRLKAAVKRAGGNKAVSEASGIPLSNVGAYLTGREMKVPALIGLARACKVNLTWLATGEGPMTGELQAPSEPQRAAPDLPVKAFATIKVDLMAQALEAAQKTFADAGAQPNSRELVQVTLLLYDGLNKP